MAPLSHGFKSQALPWTGFPFPAAILPACMALTQARQALHARRCGPTGTGIKMQAIDNINLASALDTTLSLLAAFCLGGMIGLALAVPVVAVLAALAAPFVSTLPIEAALPSLAELAASLARLPPTLLWSLPAVPVSAALIGYVAAQLAVRAWLRRLP